MDLRSRTSAVREAALELGFDRVGFAKAGPIDEDRRLFEWLERGFAGEMAYMHRTAKIRADPCELLRGAQSVIALAVSYYHPAGLPEPPLKVARYAMGRDYHRVVRKMVRRLRRKVLEIEPGAAIHPSVDTSAVLERAWAERAGIAWIGKSTMAIARDLGTYSFLATLITDLEFEYDEPQGDHCGRCTRCLDACPTQAFLGPHQLDARRCISYWTLERHSGFTKETPSFHGWMAGCDICQEVCPWNKFARPTRLEALAPRPELVKVDPKMVLEPDRDSEFEAAIRQTALARTGTEALRRNALRVLVEPQRLSAEDRQSSLS